MQIYRIKKGVKPWGGKKFKTDDDLLTTERLTGTVVTTYKNYTGYVYKLDELELVRK